jgi:hypothetical protein
VIKIASGAFFMAFMLMIISFLDWKSNLLAAYFNTVAPGMGCDEQNVLPVSIRTTQMQPVLQGLVALQPPPQLANPLVSVRSCRAETVPAHRTAVTITARNVFFIVFLPMIHLPFL